MTSTLHGLLKAHVVTLMATAARTATGNGSAIPIRGYTGVGLFVLDSAAGGGTSPTMTVSLEESADGSTGWADVPATAYLVDESAFGEVAAVASQQIRRLDLSQRKAYLREKHVILGTSPTFTYSLKMIAQKIYD